MKWRRQGPYKYSPMAKQDSVDGRSQRPSYATNTTSQHISLPTSSEMHSMLRDLFRVSFAPTRPKMSPCLGVGLQAECFGNDFDAKGEMCVGRLTTS